MEKSSKVKSSSKQKRQAQPIIGDEAKSSRSSKKTKGRSLVTMSQQRKNSGKSSQKPPAGTIVH